MNSRLLLTTSILLAPLAASAADSSFKPDFYGAIAVGRGNYTQVDKFGSAVFDRMVAHNNYQPIETHFTEVQAQPFAPTVTAGAEFGRYVGAEASYVNLGHGDWYRLGDVLLPNARGTGFLPPGARYYDQHTSFRTDGFALSVLGRWPLGQHWRVQGRVGAFRSRTKGKASLCHDTNSSSSNASLDGGTGSGSYTPREDCSPITVTNPSTGAPMGGFGPGNLGNLHFSSRSTKPMYGLGVEHVWNGGIGFGVEYNFYRTRHPQVAEEDASPLPGVRSSETVHFLSIRISFRPWSE